MQLKIKTWEVLQAEGFKRNHGVCYVGNFKHPDAKFSGSFVEALCGKTVTVHKLRDDEYSSSNDCDQALCTVAKVERKFRVPLFLFENPPDITKLPEPVLKRFQWSPNDAKFDVVDHSFEFPCKFQELTEIQAVEVARWIMKMAGAV